MVAAPVFHYVCLAPRARLDTILLAPFIVGERVLRHPALELGAGEAFVELDIARRAHSR